MRTADGYVREIDYTHGYCAELAPGLLALACASSGIAGLPEDRPLRYLELACGQGVSLNIHAAAAPGDYWGIDFNPAHAANARDLAAASGQDLVSRIDASIAFAQSLSEAGAKFFGAHPALDAWLTDMRGRSPHYLAHEYFNRDWHPMPSAEVAQALSAAGLSFAASATLSDHDPGLGLPEKARALLAGVDHPAMRETVFDYLVNRRFRRDLYARGAARLSPAEREERLRAIPFALLQHPDHVPARVRVSGGETALPAQMLRSLVAALAAEDYAPKTLARLEGFPGCGEIGFANLLQAALLLTSAGSLHPAQSAQALEAAAPRCSALNARILEIAAATGKGSSLASPVIGAGVYAERREMLFLHAIALGKSREEEWARHAWECLNADAAASVAADEGLAGLLADAHAFARIRLPVLRALRVA